MRNGPSISRTRVLVLSPYPEKLMPAFKNRDCEVLVSTSEPTLLPDADWVVSFGYRHILGRPSINRYQERIINIHISMLPWNRGSDPNLWSFFDNTPKGVTIHQIDAGLDTGPIFAQEKISFSGNQTLKTSYDILQSAASLLFCSTWDSILKDKITGKKQQKGGTYHRSADKERIMSKLPLGWDTPTSVVEKMGEESRGKPVKGIY